MWLGYPNRFWAAESESALRISPSLGKKCKILEVSGSVKVIFIIYYII